MKKRKILNKYKNNKGFTLIELLAVIAIIALLSLIAIPSIVGLADGIRKDNMLEDARKFVSLAKYEVNKNYSIRNSESYEFRLTDLNLSGFSKDDEKGGIKDPDGGVYDLSQSFVRYEKKDKGKYSIVLVSSKRRIGDPSTKECVDEDGLHDKDNVHDLNEDLNEDE